MSVLQYKPGKLCKITRLLGRFAPIFYLNCEHVLFVYILKQKQTNKNRGFHEKVSWILKIYWKSNFFRGFHKKIRGLGKFKKNL